MMKASTCYALTLLVSLALAHLTLEAKPVAGDAAVKDTVRILTIGNSFADNLMEMSPAMAKSAGKTIIVGKANLGGSGLKRHVESLEAFEANAADPIGSPYAASTPGEPPAAKTNLRKILESQEWDYITVQQFSGDSYKIGSYEPYLKKLVDYVHRYAPKAKMVFVQTWAYRPDHPQLAAEGITQQKMAADIINVYNQLSAQYGFDVIPCGEAFQAGRALPRWQFAKDPEFDYAHPAAGSLPKEHGDFNVGWYWKKPKTGDPETFQVDAKHCNEDGKYLLACVLYQYLFGGVENVTFDPPSVKPEDAATLRTIARDTVDKRAAVKAARPS